MKRDLTLILILLITSCASIKKLPEEKYYAFKYRFNRTYEGGIVAFNLKNPLMCPINIKLVTDSLNPGLEKIFGQVTLKELQDTIVQVKYLNFNSTNRTNYIVGYGDLNKKIEKNKLGFPFPKGKRYKVIQGYNGRFTHNDLYSRYAIDFNLKIGDTITSVDSGYIVGLIEDYKDYGTTKEWLDNDKSNYITVYHPHSGLFSQYVHLDHKGALLKLGESVKKGQAIGISGRTGFTTMPHLHFNVKIPNDKNGLISTEIEFENGVAGRDLKIKKPYSNN